MTVPGPPNPSSNISSMELYPWQRASVDDLAAAGYVGLLNWDVGSGKTVAAATAIHESGADVTLIVAPLSTHQSAWLPTVRAVSGREARVIGNGKKAHREALSDFVLGYPGVYVVTPQLMTRADTSEWAGDMVIVDEVHQVCTPRSKSQRKLGGSDPMDAQSALAGRFRMRLALSGTPSRQNFQNMWGVVRFLWPFRDEPGDIGDMNFYRWEMNRMSYETVYTNQRDRDGNVKQVKKFLNESIPGRLVAELPCVTTHKRREKCCEWHPEGFLDVSEPQVIDRRVELSSKQKKAIDELQEHYMTWLGDHPLQAELSLVQQARIRQLCLGVPTVDYTVSDVGDETVAVSFDPDCVSPFVDEALEILSEVPEDEPVVVFLDSQKFAEVLVSRLNRAGVSAEEYSGRRKAALNGFGSGYRVLVGVTSAIGTGTDGLQRKSKTEIWFEQPVSVTARTQAEGRLDRQGGRGQVQRFRILDDTGYAEGRIDDSLLKQMMINRSLRLAGTDDTPGMQAA